METTGAWSIVHLSSIAGELRFEPEYYQPKYLALERTLNGFNGESLGNLAMMVKSGPFGSSLLKETYTADGVILLRPFNIKDGAFENENLVFVSQADLDAQGIGLYAPEDLAFARVGDIRCGIIPDFGRPITISPNIIVARLDKRRLNPYFVTVFMNTELGSFQLKRAMKVVAQPTITVETVKSLRIPVVALHLQAEAESLLRASFDKRKESETLYAEAETLLLAGLGLFQLDLSHEATYTAQFSDAWAAGRLDAEHFQPKYDILRKQLEATGQAIVLGDWLAEPIRRGMQPEYDDHGDVIVINSQHVGKTHVELADNRRRFACLRRTESTRRCSSL